MLLGYCLAVFLASDFEQLTWGSRSGALKFYRTYFERLGEYMGPLGLGVSPAGGDFTLAKVRPAASASLAA